MRLCLFSSERRLAAAFGTHGISLGTGPYSHRKEVSFSFQEEKKAERYNWAFQSHLTKAFMWKRNLPVKEIGELLWIPFPSNQRCFVFTIINRTICICVESNRGNIPSSLPKGNEEHPQKFV